LDEKGLELKVVAQVARVALTGKNVSPGLFETMHALGRTLTLQRLRSAADIARAS
jgi:glutamyl-tRNA synthetase